jgi:hypothetical protein
MDMNEDDRKAYLVNLQMEAKAKEVFDERFGNFATLMSPYLSLFV